MKDNLLTIALVMCLFFMSGCSRGLNNMILPKTGESHPSGFDMFSVKSHQSLTKKIAQSDSDVWQSSFKLSANKSSTEIQNDTIVSDSSPISNLSTSHRAQKLRDSDSEQIKQVIHQYYAAEKAGDFATANQIRDGALISIHENRDEIIRSYKDNAEKTIEDIVVREISVNLMPDQKSAVVNIVYWFVRKDFPKENRGFPRKKNIVYEEWGMKKKNEKWRLTELKSQYTEEEYQRNIAYEPVDALYQHLTSVLSDSEHGGVCIIDTTDYSCHTDDYLPHSYRLLIWVIDEEAIHNAINGYKENSVKISYKKAKYSVEKLLGFCREIRESPIGKFIYIGLGSKTNKIELYIKNEKYTDNVIRYLNNYHAKDAIQMQVENLKPFET